MQMPLIVASNIDLPAATKWKFGRPTVVVHAGVKERRHFRHEKGRERTLRITSETLSRKRLPKPWLDLGNNT
jgi:hypothetical protein